MKTFITAFCLALAVSVCWALPGPEIPTPSPSVEKAIKAADSFFRSTYIQKMDERTKNWMAESIIDSAIYKSDQNEWFWFITFRHPRGNDKSWVFRVNRDESVFPFPVQATD